MGLIGSQSEGKRSHLYTKAVFLKSGGTLISMAKYGLLDVMKTEIIQAGDEELLIQLTTLHLGVLQKIRATLTLLNRHACSAMERIFI